MWYAFGMDTKELWINSGYSVLPVVPNGKKPLVPWSRFQHDKATPEEMEQWWRQNPDANVGLVCGQINRLVALDCDSSEADELARSLGLPETVCVKTPRGFHHYFGIDANKVVKTIPQGGLNILGCELRGEGSYVVAPPSVRDGVRYEWMRQLGSTPLSPFSSIPVAVLGSGGALKRAEGSLVLTPSSFLQHEGFSKEAGEEKQPLSFSGAVEGYRNTGLARIAGSLIRSGASLVETFNIACAVNLRNVPPLGEDEVIRVVESIWKLHRNTDHKETFSCGTPIEFHTVKTTDTKESINGIEGVYTPSGTFSFFTKNEGYSKEQMKTKTDPTFSKNDVSNTLPSKTMKIENVEKEWPIYNITELPPTLPIEWVFEGYLAKGRITELAGIGKGGKTTLVANLIKNMKEGKDLIGQKVAKGKALVISEENHDEWSDRRDRDTLGDNIGLLCQPFNTKPTEDEWLRLIESVAARQKGYDLVVIDTLANLWPVVDENKSGGVIAALTPLRMIANKRTAVLVIHHTRKSGGSEGKASRGTGGLPAFVDILMEYNRYGQGSTTKRVITAFSRRPETPTELVIDYKDNEYVLLQPEGKEGKKRKKETDILEELKRAPNGMTQEELKASIDTDDTGSLTLWRTLRKVLSEGKVTATRNQNKEYVYFYNERKKNDGIHLHQDGSDSSEPV